MSTIPGNPYAEFHQHQPTITEDDGQWAIAQATLALAHEQRTKNIIALAALCTANGRKELGEPFIELASERLGLDGDDS